MQKMLIGLTLSMSVFAVQAETNVGVSISLGQPGFYGTLDLNNYPQPQLIAVNPSVIYAVPAGAQPLYLKVPRNHRLHWKNYCSRYNACNRQVYFVSHTWYNNVYVPQYQTRHPQEYRDDDRGYASPHGQGQPYGDNHGNSHEQSDGNEHNNGRGQNNGHDQGNGKGQGNKNKRH